jgi:hypothetical protein
MVFRNERKLYHRTCNASKKPIISMYSPDKTIKVYDQKIRWSDARDAMDYGREFDFSLTFTEQFGNIRQNVPMPSLYNFFAENSDYCNCSNYLKLCYLVTASSKSEQSLYGAYTNMSYNCVDTAMTFDSEQCYQTIDCNKCHMCFYSSNLENCTRVISSVNCRGCTDCINCNDIDNKQYCIDNIQYSSDEYAELRSQLFAKQLQRFVHEQKDTIYQSERTS